MIMGTSNWQNISYNIGLVRKINPKSILDVGVGFGRWGILFREFLETWDHGIYDGDWNITIDGVEIFPDYIREYHKFFYTAVYINNALDYLRSMEKEYDLINFGDVLEHMDRAEGEVAINTALDKSRFVLINVPIGKHWQQDGTGENPHEAHRSVWYNRDFVKYRHNKIKCFEDNTKRDYSVILLSNRRFRFDNRYGRFFSFKNFLKHKLGLRKLVERYERNKQKK